MIFYIIPGLVVIGSISAILFIILKNFSKLKNINVESITEVKEKAVKDRMITDRLKRKALGVARVSKDIYRPIVEKVSGSFSATYKKVMEIEKDLREKSNPLRPFEKKLEAKEVSQTAEKLFDEDKLKEAEDKYIEAIQLDPKNLDVYEGLLDVYRETKDYRKAKEICRYCIKLMSKKALESEKHRLACFYEELGDIYQIEGKNQLAFNNYQKSVDLEPYNPRFLDLLLKISIMLKHKDSAWRAFNALKEADPENQKLSDLEKEISKIE